MFGGPGDRASPSRTPKMSPTKQRWNAFLDQIATRHEQILEEVLLRMATELRAESDVATRLSMLWSPAASRLLELRSRVETTFAEKVEPAFEAEGASGEEVARERVRGQRLVFELENAEFDREKGALAALARTWFGAVVSGGTILLGCGGCGARLEVLPTPIAVHHRCPSCGGDVLFVPSEGLRLALAMGAHPIAETAARAERLAQREVEWKLRSAPSPRPLELLKEYEAAQIAYATAYFNALGRLEPARSNVALEVRARLAAWYEYSARFETEWMAAGDPRLV